MKAAGRRPAEQHIRLDHHARPPDTAPAAWGRHPRDATPQRTDLMLTVSGLTKRFGGFTALNAVSFEVREGEILGLIGPNGSGKTTAFNCVSGALPRPAGSIRFRGGEGAAGLRGAGGLKKRAGAGALATGPKLLLADESLGGLDPSEMASAAEMLKRIRAEL